MFGSGFRDKSTNESFSDGRNLAAKVVHKFKDGSSVPTAKKSIVKKEKSTSKDTKGTKCLKDGERVGWMNEHDVWYWPVTDAPCVHSMEEQYDVEAYLLIDEWKRIAYDMKGIDMVAQWYLTSPPHVKRALESCSKNPSWISKYAMTGSRTTQHGVQFFKHADGSIALLREPGVECKCGVYHPHRT
jgi:hypothetical protein